MRMLNNRECGALEAPDTFLGISLYGTVPKTTIRWVDTNIFRSRKLKTRKEIEALEAQSTDIFAPSLIDNDYVNRPKELESTHLHKFAKLYDITKSEPTARKKYYKIGPSLFIKKRSREYLINHYKHNVEIQPKNYYSSLLLLFKPWRDTDELKKWV